MFPSTAETVDELITSLAGSPRGLHFVTGDTTHFLSYESLAARTEDLAARWSGLGVHRGDRVILVVADEREFVLAFLSALRAGVIPAPVYPPVAFGQLTAYLGTLRGICTAAGASRVVVSDMLMPLFDGVDMPVPPTPISEFQNAAPGAAGRPEPQGPAFLQFTSGSTGSPKGVVLTHRTLLAHTRLISGPGMGVDPDRDRGVSWLPLYHDMGLIGFLLAPMMCGAETWFIPPLQFARDPLCWPQKISEVGATISFAPNFAYGLVARRATDEAVAGMRLSSWRIAGCGAEPVRVDTLRQFADRFAAAGFSPAALMPSYGLAEATLAVALAPWGSGMRTMRVDADRLAGEGLAQEPDGSTARVSEFVSCGRALPGTEIRIVDADLGAGGDIADRGDDVEGEILVRSDTLASGYFGDLELTARTWRDGWLWTGDRGFRHDCDLYVTGRVKDLIIINGRNCHPSDVEWIAAQVPGVRPGNVIALGGEGTDTEALRIVLEARPGANPAEVAKGVRRHVRAQLGLVVRDVFLLPPGTLPKTSSGKLRRAHTAELLDAKALTSATSA